MGYKARESMRVYEIRTTRQPVARELIAGLECMDTPSRAAVIAHRRLGEETREHFMAFFLDAHLKIVGFEIVSIGTMTEAWLHPRELFRAAIGALAHSVLLVHNHPSGDVTPSAEDNALTKRIMAAGETVGIPVIDHLIVGGGMFYSFAGYRTEEVPS